MLTFPPVDGELPVPYELTGFGARGANPMRYTTLSKGRSRHCKSISTRPPHASARPSRSKRRTAAPSRPYHPLDFLFLAQLQRVLGEFLSRLAVARGG